MNFKDYSQVSGNNYNNVAGISIGLIIWYMLLTYFECDKKRNSLH